MQFNLTLARALVWIHIVFWQPRWLHACWTLLQKNSHQFKWSVSSLLVSTCGTASGVLCCPVWGSSLKGRHRVAGGSSVKSHQVD